MRKELLKFAYIAKGLHDALLDYDDIRELVMFGDLEGTLSHQSMGLDESLIPFIHYITKGSEVADIYSNNERVTRSFLSALSKLSDDDIYSNVDAFMIDSDKPIIDEMDEYDLDNVVAKSGYHRVRCIKKGKPTVCLKKLKGNKRKKILSPAQKMALRKAVIKAHQGAAKMKRSRSFKKGKVAGFHR